MKKLVCLVAIISLACAAIARPHGGMPPPRHGGHHLRHHGGIAAGIIGGAIVGGLLYDALRPAPVVVSQPTVVVPQPVVVQPPVVVQQPVIVQQPAQPVYQVQNVWVAGRYVDQVQSNGTVVRVWQPGHYEQQKVLIN